MQLHGVTCQVLEQVLGTEAVSLHCSRVITQGQHRSQQGWSRLQSPFWPEGLHMSKCRA